MERKGRFVRMASTLDENGHVDMRRRLGESVGEIERGMSRQVKELYAILHQYRPESILGSLWFRNAPKGYADAPITHDKEETSYAHVEYLAILYVRNRGSGSEFVVQPHVVEDIRQRVESLFQSTVWLWMAQDAARYGANEGEVPRELRFMTLINSLVVRYPGHFDHMKEMLLGIEAQMAQDLTQWLGWSIADAVAVGDAIITLVDERLNANFARGAKEAEKMRDSSWPRGHGVFARSVKCLLSLYPRPRKRKMLYGLAAWIQFLMQSSTTFTVDELSSAAGVERGRVASLMNAASLLWDSCTEDYFGYPHPTPPILTRPCLDLGDDNYLVVVPTSFSWAIRGLVEDALKSMEANGNTHCWSAYERARAGFTERATVEQLAKAFPHGGAFHSLRYSWVKDGATIQGELDGLLLTDDTAVLVEVKAGSLSPEARRGAPDRLREQLKGLVGKAHEQALKAREFMKSAPSVAFDLAGDEKLEVQSARFNDFVLVTVNLDPLDMFTTNLNKLVDLDVLSDADLPWAVSYLDLVVIADALEFPVQMIHYLKRRQRVNQLGFVIAHDELDWFGHYLEEGLYFEHLKDTARDAEGHFTSSISGYSEALDAHYMHDGRYSNERPPIPRQYMPESMRDTLRELEDAQHHGYAHLSLALLDLGWQAREDFFSNAEELITRTRVDGRNHDMTMLLDDGQGGLTFMCDTQRERLQKDLFTYCQLKKYQCRCDTWVGIGKLLDSNMWVDEAIVVKHPWEYNDDLEQLLARSS